MDLYALIAPAASACWAVLAGQIIGNCVSPLESPLLYMNTIVSTYSPVRFIQWKPGLSHFIHTYFSKYRHGGKAASPTQATSAVGADNCEDDYITVSF